jgi:hypothetical protein
MKNKEIVVIWRYPHWWYGEEKSKHWLTLCLLFSCYVIISADFYRSNFWGKNTQILIIDNLSEIQHTFIFLIIGVGTVLETLGYSKLSYFTNFVGEILKCAHKCCWTSLSCTLVIGVSFLFFAHFSILFKIAY